MFTSPQMRTLKSLQIRLFSEKHSPEYIKVFHGTDNVNVIDSGLIPSNMYKTRRVAQDSPGTRLVTRKKAVFLSPDISIALYYGNIIVEVLLNKNMTQAVHDEEYFPIGLIPNYPDPR